MRPYERAYKTWFVIFALSSVVVAANIIFIYAGLWQFVPPHWLLFTAIAGLVISIPPYAYYKARHDEMKKQEQYDVEMLGVLGQQNLDEQESQTESRLKR